MVSSKRQKGAKNNCQCSIAAGGLRKDTAMYISNKSNIYGRKGSWQHSTYQIIPGFSNWYDDSHVPQYTVSFIAIHTYVQVLASKHTCLEKYNNKNSWKIIGPFLIEEGFFFCCWPFGRFRVLSSVSAQCASSAQAPLVLLSELVLGLPKKFRLFRLSWLV